MTLRHTYAPDMLPGQRQHAGCFQRSSRCLSKGLSGISIFPIQCLQLIEKENAKIQFETQSTFFQHPHSWRKQNFFALEAHSPTLSGRQERRSFPHSFQNSSSQGGSSPCVQHCAPPGWAVEVPNSLGLRGWGGGQEF